VSKYHIDGLRVDAVKHVPKSFWAEFSKAAGVFTIGEVLDRSMPFVAGYVGSLDSVLNYPFYYRVSETLFQNKNMLTLSNYFSEFGQHTNLNNLHYFGNFCDNHDNPRLLSLPGSDW
jgi:alpha-amylase